MSSVSSPLGDILGAEAATFLGRDYNCYSVADLLAVLPVTYSHPPPEAAISQLQTGYRAVVRGSVIGNERRLFNVPGMSRRVNVTVTIVRDHTAQLEIYWVDRRNDVPAGLRPGAAVVMLADPHRNEWREFLQKRFRILVYDPTIEVFEDPRDVVPIPGIDAPFAEYSDESGGTSDRLASFVMSILEAIKPLPDRLELRDGRAVEGAVLARVLTGLHTPSSAQELAFAWERRQWALDVLASLRIERPPMPPPRLIKTPQDAEEYARDVLAAFGFVGTAVTASGRDGGVDVRGQDVIAQVKLEGVKTDAPRLQALTGIAAHERKFPVFFSLGGYSGAALEWAEQVGMALFEFNYAGGVEPQSTAAHRVVLHGASAASPSGP